MVYVRPFSQDTVTSDVPSKNTEVHIEWSVKTRGVVTRDPISQLLVSAAREAAGGEARGGAAAACQCRTLTPSIDAASALHNHRQ
ncbi:unnamed protein product [Danaus chrysippus]|uniref:(African queen) hypothetical protein n=1 Tax=Danaus chrysippus TaxID=151541 RepID=A0A8J2VUM3_9NEOP|nr:unnamed protein product [Danaus chrysippus]